MSSPFGTEPLTEIPLGRSPLVRVLAQVRFPRLVMLGTAGSDSAEILQLLQGIARTYPILEEGHEVVIQLSPEGATQSKGAFVRQLRSADRAWTVTLSDASIALDTGAYTSRAEFTTRFGHILELLAEALDMPPAERIGIRYINRVQDRDLLKRLPELVRREVLGGQAVERPADVTIVHTLNDALYQLPHGRLQARWGLLPPQAVLDPSLTPVPEMTWVLDLDSYSETPTAFNPMELSERAFTLAESAYRYFRWVVQPEFLRVFGGDDDNAGQ